MNAQAFVNVVIPFDAAFAAPVDAAVEALRAPDTGNHPAPAAEKALAQMPALHFMSITVVKPVCPAEEDGSPPGAQPADPAHLVFEITADGGAGEVLENLAQCFAAPLAALLAAARKQHDPRQLAAYLQAHAVRISDDWSWRTALDGLLRGARLLSPARIRCWLSRVALGQVFSGSPGMTAERIRRERDLAAHLRHEVGAARGTSQSPRQKVDAIRDKLWNGAHGTWKWAFVPEPAPLLGPSPDSARSPFNPQFRKAIATVLHKLCWPLYLPVGLFFAWAVARVWEHNGRAVGLLWIVVSAGSLLAVFLLAVRLAVEWLRILERTDPVENRMPTARHGQALLEMENFCEQNHLASVSRLKPGLLRRLALRLAFIVVGTGRFVCAPGFLGKNGVIHSARWMRLPGTDLLLFRSNFDGTWESYVADFIADAPTGVTAIWSNCVGFPRTRLLFGGGAADRDRLVMWARRQQQPTRFWYCAYRNLTAARIRTNAAIRQGLATAQTYQDCQDWLSLFGSAPRPASSLAVPEITTIAFGGLSDLRFSTCLGVAFGANAKSEDCMAFLERLRGDVSYGEARIDWTTALVLALSSRALRRLGLPDDAIETFPIGFKQGMATPSRARLLRDEGVHGPDQWRWGGPNKEVDVFLTVYGKEQGDRARLVRKVKDAVGTLHAIVMEQDLADLAEKPAAGSRGVSPREPFGFSDGVSQPILRGAPGRNMKEQNSMHVVEPGEFIYGYPDNTGVIPPAPSLPAHMDPLHMLPDAEANPFRQRPEFSSYEGQGRRDLGANGTYLVVRHLQQDVKKFEQWFDADAMQQLEHYVTAVPVGKGDFFRVQLAGFGSAAAVPWKGAGRPPYADQVMELVRAKMMGRWKDGASLVRNSRPPGPAADAPAREPDNDFLYAEDPAALGCPFGAHMRRANPRDTRFPGTTEEIASTNRHRMLRIGRVYGQPDPALLNTLDTGKEQGLMFMCLNIDIERQFEFVQRTWILNPSIHGLEREVDPILGHGPREFTIPTSSGPVCLRNLPDFVLVQGGGYFFVPSKSLLRFLATGGRDAPAQAPAAAAVDGHIDVDVVPPATRPVAHAAAVAAARTESAGGDRIRVLSLDGGGTRASVLAQALGEMYGHDTPGRAILKQFSCVAGNSGGSIVIAALCCDYTPRQIVALYSDPDSLTRLFCPTWIARFPSIARYLPHYSTERKLASLRDVLDANRKEGEPLPSQVRLADWPGLLGADLDLLIPAFDVDRKRTTFFRSNTQSKAKSSDPRLDVTLLEAIHASTTAPIFYFDGPACFRGRRFWDGAMGGYNNPVLAAVVEVLANHPGRADAVRVLSIGTGAQARPPASEADPPLGQRAANSWLEQLGVAAAVIFDDPPDAATFHAHVALGQPLPSQPGVPVAGNIVRISPFVHPARQGGAWVVPAGFTTREFAELLDMRLDVRDRRGVTAIARLTQLWIDGIVPNQPVRAGQFFSCDIGDPDFAAAVARWRRISA